MCIRDSNRGVRGVAFSSFFVVGADVETDDLFVLRFGAGASRAAQELSVQQRTENSNRKFVGVHARGGLEQRNPRFVSPREIDDAMAKQLELRLHLGRVLRGFDTSLVEVELIGRSGMNVCVIFGKQVQLTTPEICDRSTGTNPADRLDAEIVGNIGS